MLSELAYILRQLPFFRILLPFIGGVYFQLQTQSNFSGYAYILSFILLIWVIFDNFSKTIYKFRFVYGVIFYSVLVVLGIISVKISAPKRFNFYDKEITATAILTEPIDEKDNSYKTVLRLVEIKNGDTTYTDNHKILTYFAKDSAAKQLKYGDKIVFSATISEITVPGNPHEFNYKKYLYGKKIVAQTYLNTGKYQLIKNNCGYTIFSIAYSVRSTLADIYRENHIEGQELAVLQALTLGDKSELTQETKKSYVAAGAMHILAVSGLHVGIIYFLLNLLFGKLDKLKYKEKNYGRVLKAAILIFSLWFFALLSGFSASVSRAAVMFTFFIIGSALNRNVNIYNSLAASAFLLLTINPFLLSEVGFQLSYIAVISIVYLQPKINNLFTFKNKILRWAWSLTSVSIAAQIGTGPVSLYYFHIFPNWFILANLIVIPAATLIVYSAASLFITSFIPYISDFFAIILKYIVSGLNYSVEFIEKLPFSVTDNISFGIDNLAFTYLLIISLTMFFVMKKVKFLISSLSIISILLIFGIVKKYEIYSQKYIYVYNIRKSQNINFIDGKNNILAGDSLIMTGKNLEFATKGNFLHLQTPKMTFINLKDSVFESNPLKKAGNYFSFLNKKILLIDNSDQLKFTSNKKIDIDFLILSKNIYVFIEDILELYSPKTVIFDASNKDFRIEKWKEECKKFKLNFCSIPEQGAFCAKL